MRKIVLFVALTFISLSVVRAQNYGDVSGNDAAQYESRDIISSLSSMGYDRARTTINSDVAVTLDKPNLAKEVKGYRIRIFFDNKQSSRSDAEVAIMKYEKLYPNSKTYLTYEPPYFKVTAGNFMGRTEAVNVWGKILGEFPTAFIVTENIPLYLLLESQE
ncbi:MAG: hypothetical protein R3Y50_03325 [Rikenellaceae bacterium]